MSKSDKQGFSVRQTVIALTLALTPFATQAAGLGKISVFSALGQPLQAEIEVLASPEEAQSIQAHLADAGAFRQANIEYAASLGTLKFAPIKERNGRQFIQVTSDRPLNEPFVDMLVELNWASGRMVREYTFLLDPAPANASAEAGAPTSVNAPIVRPEIEKLSSASSASAASASSKKTQASVKNTKPSAAASEQPASPDQQHYTVAKGDTLGKIAAKNLPAGVTLEQMLVALFRSNPAAFSGNNMNRIRAGKILTIPDATTAENIPEKEAHHEIVAQAADFNTYRQKLAAAAAGAAAETATTEQASSGKIVPKVTEATPPAAEKDKLEISRTAESKGGKPAAKAAAVEEDAIARDRALKEANERVVDLEKQLAAMKQLAELKSKTGSQLQQQATSGGKPPEPAPAAKAAPEKSQAADKTSPPAAVAAPETSTPAKPEEANQKPAEAAPTATPAQPAPPPAKPKKKIVLPPPEPEPEPSFFEENPTAVYGGAGILALLLGWLGFRHWKKRKDAAADDIHDAGDYDVSSGYGDSAAATIAAPPPSEQQASRFSDTVTPPPMDVLTEADTFLAFGRDAQAEEVLLAGMEKEPERHEIALKLLEIYAARKSRGDFETVARRLHQKTGSSGPLWERAAAMGGTLDPENALYRTEKLAPSAPPLQPIQPAQPAPSAPPVSLAKTVEAPVAAVAATAAAVESVAVKATPSAEAPVIAPAVAPAASTALLEPLDFELDFEPESLETKPEPLLETAPASDPHALDFDLSLPEPAAPASSASSAATTAAPLDLVLDTPATALSGQAATTTTVIDVGQHANDGHALDFDFNLLSDKETPASPVSSAPTSVDTAAAPPAAPAPMDFSGIDLNLETPAAGAVSPAPTFDVAGGDAASEVATKLELAAAYEEMGDHEGARELYREALAEGNPMQQETARAKLAALG